MNPNQENTPTESQATVEMYSNAMNFIGQNLLTALTQSLERLPANCRNTKVVTNGLAAFISNVIFKQAKGDEALCPKMLEDITKIIHVQFEQFAEASKT